MNLRDRALALLALAAGLFPGVLLALRAGEGPRQVAVVLTEAMLFGDGLGTARLAHERLGAQNGGVLLAGRLDSVNFADLSCVGLVGRRLHLGVGGAGHETLHPGVAASLVAARFLTAHLGLEGDLAVRLLR